MAKRLRSPLVFVLFAGAAALGAWYQPQPAGESHAGKRLMATSGEADENRYDQPDAAAAYWASLHQTPAGLSASQLNVEAQAAVERLERQSATLAGGATAPTLRIESWGPGNFGGRLRGIVIKADDTDVMLVGSVSGGMWKSTDGGASWTATNDFLDSLAVGSMITDPDDTNRVFVGTGEGFFNVDASQGLGIYQSSDFGSTWTLLANTDNSNFFYVNRLVRIPGTNKLLAATRTGIWGTDDFTAVSPVWTERSGFGVSSRGFVDLKLDPTTTSPSARIYAYHFGIDDTTRRVWRSTNDGASFSQLGAAEGIPTTNLRRMEIGVGTDGVVYLSVANGSDATRGLWRSPVGGSAFTQAASATAFIERQGWYDLIAGVKPGDSNTVYVGAVDMYKTVNAGTTITKKTFWNPGSGQYPDNYVHADLHVVTFDPTNPNTLFIGCDGGIFKSTDEGETWTELNFDLRVAQYYGIAAHPDGEGVIGGTQDNGSHLYFGKNDVWLEWFGGDGGFSAWDQQQTQFIYGATPNGGLFGSGDGGSTRAQIALPSTTGSLFITPFTLDPNNGARMMVGTNRVYFSTNIRALGSATFTDDSGTLTGSVSALAFSPHSTTTAYAGTSSGRIYRTTTLGTPSTWAQIQDAAMSGFDITWIEVDPNDGTGNTLYATLADYGADRVWKSTNGGTSWTSIHANLPDIPLYAVVVDPTNPDRLWLGSELGLWTTDGNSTNTFDWVRYDYGTAWTRVTQLIWATDDVLWMGTHGRSIYKATRNVLSARITAIDDSAGGCDMDGYLDPAETAQVTVEVTNEGPDTASSVQVSLASLYPGLSVLSGAQSYGSLLPGNSASQTFSVRLSYASQCRDTAQVRADFTYTGGSGSQPLDLFVAASPQAGPLTEDAEDADTAFTHSARVGSDDWARVTTSAHTGTNSWFAADIGGFCDKSLVSPWVDVGGGSTTLSFWLRYNMEGDASQYWDGGVVELRTEGGDWIDIGNLSTVAYDGQLFNNNTSPGTLAWSGSQLTWRNGVVNLGATYNGQKIQVRFRVICDESSANVGFWLDDISLSNVTWPGCDALGCSALFSDGFETGDTSAWTLTVP